MKERFVMNTDMHMGPICRNLKAGDVVEYDSGLNTMCINGTKLPDDGRKRGSTEGFAEVARILKKQGAGNPDSPFADDISSTAKGDSDSSFTKTDTLAVLPILGCLDESERWLGDKQDWAPVSEPQSEFLDLFEDCLRYVGQLTDILKGKASDKAADINGWLADNGFDLELQPVDRPRTFYVASILNVLVEWLGGAEKDTVTNDKGTFEAVRLKRGVSACYNGDIHGYPVVRILTKSRDVLCMSVCEKLPDTKFAIHWKVQELQRVQRPWMCEGVVFPMVKYDQKIDISWLKGLKTNPSDPCWEVAEAIQQTKFQMDEHGAKAESAAAMTMVFRSCVGQAPATPLPWVTIDKPFILWIERGNVTIPLFAGTFAEDTWSN